MASIGVFGGSFDPPHAGHLLACTYAMSSLGFDRLVVVPTFQHVFAKKLTGYEHRVEMCSLAMRDLARVEISTIERELGGESRMVRTLGELRERNPEAQLSLIVGSDIVADLPRWHGVDEIKSIARFVVLGREGHVDAGIVLPLHMPAVSSTEIRARIARGESIEGLVPHAVVDYIREHALYEDP